jgi:hypothetical protein
VDSPGRDPRRGARPHERPALSPWSPTSVAYLSKSCCSSRPQQSGGSGSTSSPASDDQDRTTR